MNQFSRRNILKALLAAPALSALRPLASAQPGPLTVDGLMTLNILFHGPFSFVIYDNRVEVLTPHQDDHTYRFWGVDPPPNPYPHLPAGTHFVQGLKGEKTAP